MAQPPERPSDSLLLQAAQIRRAPAEPAATLLGRAGEQQQQHIRTSWTPYTRFLRAHSAHSQAAKREQYGVQVDVADGSAVPPFMTRFSQMRLPAAALSYLGQERGITRPTGVQMQGIPTALAGRDLIGIAYTGSGKSLVFTLPLVLFALEAEDSLAYGAGEGPLGLVVVPSRELAKQIHEQIQEMAAYMHRKRYPALRTLLCIGGTALHEQTDALRRGVHLVVATPGRLLDLLERRLVSLDGCRHFCLDEADRMVDLGFEAELRRILQHFTRPRQTLLFSATMPSSIREFARTALFDPVLLSMGRAGAASRNITQCVEWVPAEARLQALLAALQKTAPPVVIFSQSKWDVDDVQEALLRRGVEAVAIHGSRTQEERTHAIDAFKAGRADVLVATDVASKGLDFPGIQHVINLDMPSEIEDYVHRIGRTGRGALTGVATTFVGGACSAAILLDLKALLLEAGQPLPGFLADLGGAGVAEACPVCGGLGHAERSCPKLSLQTSKAMSQLRGDDSAGY